MLVAVQYWTADRRNAADFTHSVAPSDGQGARYGAPLEGLPPVDNRTGELGENKDEFGPA